MRPSGSELGFERLCCLIYLDHNEDHILVRNICIHLRLYFTNICVKKVLCSSAEIIIWAKSKPRIDEKLVSFFLKQLESKTCSRFELNGSESVQRLYSLAGTMCPWRVILVAVDKLLDRQVKWWFYVKVTKFHTCFWPLNHYFLVPLSNLILSHISQTAGQSMYWRRMFSKLYIRNLSFPIQI